jgi:hypothetical protein
MMVQDSENSSQGIEEERTKQDAAEKEEEEQNKFLKQANINLCNQMEF